jgi:hypothetical protein
MQNMQELQLKYQNVEKITIMIEDIDWKFNIIRIFD